jgi:hypothetical protein
MHFWIKRCDSFAETIERKEVVVADNDKPLCSRVPFKELW